MHGNVYCIKYQQTEVDRYVLKYHNYNIVINDALGKKNGVSDYDVHTYWKNDEIDIDIHPNDLQIKCVAKHLGIYDSTGEPEKYYYSVIATHLTEGGITITGFELGFETMEEKSTKLSADEKEK